MKLKIAHVTRYSYAEPKRAIVQSLRLRPSRYDGLTVTDWNIDVPGSVRGAAFRDGAGDRIETSFVLGPVSEITISVKGEVETRDTAGVLLGHRETVPPLAYLRTTMATDADKALSELSDEIAGQGGAEIEKAHRLMHAVRAAIDYTPGATSAGTTAAEAMALGHGVCQDHAHAMIAVACRAGLPARYVVGYLYSEAEAHEASHAWAEIYIPDLGWVGFDAANEQCPDETYVRLASGFDAEDAAPIRGVTAGAGAEDLKVDVAVQQSSQ